MYTREAIRIYDLEIVQIEQRLSESLKSGSIGRSLEVYKEYEELEKLVRESFYMDTKDINSRSSCMSMSIKEIRDILEKIEEKS